MSKFQAHIYISDDSDDSDGSDESDDSEDSDVEKKPIEKKPAPQVKETSQKDTTARQQTSSGRPTEKHYHNYHNYVFNVSKKADADYLLDHSLKEKRILGSSTNRKPTAPPGTLGRMPRRRQPPLAYVFGT